MVTKVIVLSGRICSGKSSLAKLLEKNLGAQIVRTRDLISEAGPVPYDSRSELQEAGDAMDRLDGGRWVAMGLAQRLASCESSTPAVVLDSVRIPEQLSVLRDTFRGVLTHVHLVAKRSVLEERYKNRDSNLREFSSYVETEQNSQTEQKIDRLGDLADVVIETDQCEPTDLYARVSARIGLRPGTAAPCVDIIVGGQYGSEGKGNIVHYLSPEYDLLVRVGGPNAGHKIFMEDGRTFTFHQVPSGAHGNKKAVLVIGAGAVINLQILASEINELRLTPDRLYIDSQAVIIEPSDIEREIEELKEAIGSTASGVGFATSRKITNRIPGNLPRLARDVPELKPYIKDTVEVFADSIAKGKRIMLEGTQGTGLSLHHGFYPHVTSRVTTAPGCLAEAGLSPKQVRKVIMVCRTFPIRVGNTDTGRTSGPMRQEINLKEISLRSGIPLEELEQTEETSTTKRKRRIAEFDWAQFLRSIVLNGPTDIALTFADYLSASNRNAYRYEQLSASALRFIEELEKVGGLPVSLISTNFSHRNIIDRRAWDNSRHSE